MKSEQLSDNALNSTALMQPGDPFDLPDSLSEQIRSLSSTHYRLRSSFFMALFRSVDADPLTEYIILPDDCKEDVPPPPIGFEVYFSRYLNGRGYGYKATKSLPE